MLDVRRMRVLREVALRGSIAAAAETLGFTPSALSQQIAKLEREAGVPLVERTPRSIRLNDAGRLLVEHAEVILDRLATAEAELQALAGLHGGTLRIGSFQTASATIVASAIREFGSRFPMVDVTLAEADPVLSLARLRSGEIDLALVWEYTFVPREFGADVEVVRLLDDPVHVLLPRSHPGADRESVELAELRRDPWITSTAASSCHPFTARACRAAGFTPRVSAETNDHHVLERLVADGVGVALAPQLSLGHLHPDVLVRPVSKPPIERAIFVACRPSSSAVPRVAAMVELLRAAAREQERRFTERPPSVLAPAAA